MVIGAIVFGVILILGAVNRPDLIYAIPSLIFGKAESHQYVVKFEAANGLNANAEVRFGGAIAGKVVGLGLDADARRIVATLDVNADVPVNHASRASIAQATLTAQPHIEISVGSENSELLYRDGAIDPEVETYEELPVIPTEEGGLLGAINQLAGDVRDLVGVEARIKNDESFTTVADVVDNVNLTLEDGQDFIELTRNVIEMRNDDLGRILDEDIAAILENTEAMTASGAEFAGTAVESGDLVKQWLDENDDRLSATVESAQQIASDIESMTAELEAYKQQVSSILENTDGLSEEARQLLENNSPVIDDMLGDLREAMRFFVSFAEVLAENPQALLRGQREGGREPGDRGSLGREPDRD